MQPEITQADDGQSTDSDKLDQIFKKQVDLQIKLYNSLEPLIKNQEFININLLACFDELSEIMRESAWKNPNLIKFGWKKTQEFNEEKFKEEIVDLLHFFVNLCIAAGMNEEELFERYINKNKENHDRKDRGY